MPHLNKLLLPLLLLYICIAVPAQETSTSRAKGKKKERTTLLWGHVMDSFTKAGIPDAKITLMRTDSTVVDTMTIWYNNSTYNQTKADAFYRFTIPARPATYIIRAQHPDYEDCYINYTIGNVARNNYFDAPWHYMKRRDRSTEMERLLGEVTVKATKVKMVFKGDTIVYNADAFNLPQGSMLDALIRQLPGVELRSNGEIYVNGRKVDNLTLNGKDFFRGKNQVLLDNLPYYTVKNVQVYDKSTERSEWLGRDVEKKEHTMDITLKREYARGYMGNAEAAGGTEDRWMARLFGLRFTDNSRISAYGNLNNVNESRKPGQEGDWTPDQNPQFRQTQKMAGAELLIEDKDKRWKENASADFQWERTDDRTAQSTENYLPTGSSFARNLSSSTNDATSFWATNEFTWLKPFRLYTRLNTSYTKSEGRNFSRAAEFNHNPIAFGGTGQILDSLFATPVPGTLSGMTVNRTQNRGLQHDNELNLGGEIQFTNKLKNGDELMLWYKGFYTQRNIEDYSQYRLDYLQSTAEADDRNTFTDNHRRHYDYRAEAKYTFHWLAGWSSGFYYAYEQAYNSQDDDYYRLDIYDNWKSLGRPIGSRPSTQDSLLLCLDAYNSGRNHQLSRKSTIGMEHYLEREKENGAIWLYINLPFTNQSDELTYRSAQTDTCLSQRNWQFSPLVQFRYTLQTDKHYFFAYMEYQTEVSAPSLRSKVDVRNDRNPLAVTLGNPKLKGTVAYTLQPIISYAHLKKNAQLGFMPYFHTTRHCVANGYTYNPETGVYTYRPENVEGVWNAGLGLWGICPLDAPKRWRVNGRLNTHWNHDVNLMAVDGDTEAQPNHMHSHNIYGKLGLEYSNSRVTASVHGDGQKVHSHSELDGLKDVHVTNFSYGLACTVQLPWKLSLSTDLQMFSKRGYSERSMNTDDLVWNAQLSRSFFKGQLTAVLEGFDLLGQLSPKDFSVSATRQIEVNHLNALPRYVMLHLKYVFHKSPKRL